MNKNSKAIIFIPLIIVLLFIAYYFFTGDSALFKGQILNDPDRQAEQSRTARDPNAPKPDLKAYIEAVPADNSEDIAAKITIENAGVGSIEGTTPFQYRISINDTEVFTHTDNYSTIESGDSFTFTYPISKAIYQYPDSGNIKVELDIKDDVDESDEDNNEAELQY